MCGGCGTGLKESTRSPTPSWDFSVFPQIMWRVAATAEFSSFPHNPTSPWDWMGTRRIEDGPVACMLANPELGERAWLVGLVVWSCGVVEDRMHGGERRAPTLADAPGGLYIQQDRAIKIVSVLSDCPSHAVQPTTVWSEELERRTVRLYCRFC